MAKREKLPTGSDEVALAEAEKSNPVSFFLYGLIIIRHETSFLLSYSLFFFLSTTIREMLSLIQEQTTQSNPKRAQ